MCSLTFLGSTPYSFTLRINFPFSPTQDDCELFQAFLVRNIESCLISSGFRSASVFGRLDKGLYLLSIQCSPLERELIYSLIDFEVSISNPMNLSLVHSL